MNLKRDFLSNCIYIIYHYNKNNATYLLTFVKSYLKLGLFALQFVIIYKNYFS